MTDIRKLIEMGQDFRGESDQYSELITELADALEDVYSDSLTGQAMHAYWQERAENDKKALGEPSDTQVRGLIERAQSIVNSMKSTTGRRTSREEWCYVRFGQVSALEEVLSMMGRVSVPLDAVVEAGADELWRRVTHVGTNPGPAMSECQEIMRAALRAASAVTEQRERENL